ncbi:hypothetical protein M9H77_29439 [Catharanthus roseus]|uniref:Uncharacterized protein n=1 Tax=Catharanthus roseus TaxID=4058 RepID=A0ACB9ZVQ0_CATRO|nr:hypothetical protein M9H77_29439 [Catharanthus roseus]
MRYKYKDEVQKAMEKSMMLREVETIKKRQNPKGKQDFVGIKTSSEIWKPNPWFESFRKYKTDLGISTSTNEARYLKEKDSRANLFKREKLNRIKLEAHGHRRRPKKQGIQENRAYRRQYIPTIPSPVALGIKWAV